MAAPSFRFSPPLLSLSPDLRSVLLGSFAPPGGPWLDASHGEASDVVGIARELGLAARLGSRIKRGELEAPAEAEGELWAETRRAAIRETLHRELLEDLGRHAARLGVPLLLVKWAALADLGVLAAGARPAADVDVLVPRSRADELARVLASAGYRVGSLPATPYHAPVLHHPDLGAVEVHFALPGIDAGSGGYAGFEALEAAGHVEPSGLGEGIVRPTPVLLATHLMTHGLLQHGYRPKAYPPTRMLCDLADLRAAGLLEGPDLAARCSELTGGELTPVETGAALELVERLGRGELDLDDDSPRPSDLLLRHLLGGHVHPEYVDRLKLEEMRAPFGRGPRWRRRLAFLARTTFLSDGQIDAIYGRPRSRLGYFWRKLWRPVDLVVRWVRYARGAGRPDGDDPYSSR